MPWNSTELGSFFSIAALIPGGSSNPASWDDTAPGLEGALAVFLASGPLVSSLTVALALS